MKNRKTISNSATKIFLIIIFLKMTTKIFNNSVQMALISIKFNFKFLYDATFTIHEISRIPKTLLMLIQVTNS